MKELIESKIEEIVKYIAGKPVEEVTLDDYTILQNELKDIRYLESQLGQSKRMAELMSMAIAPADPVYGTVK